MFIKQKRIFKKFKRCVIGVSLTLVMGCTMLPTRVLAEGNEIPREVGLREKRTNQLNVSRANEKPVVGGIKRGSITDKNGTLLSFQEDGIYDKLADEGWKWDVNSKVLTLHGFNGEVGGNINYTIFVPFQTTIVLIGNNKVVNTAPVYGSGIMNAEQGGSDIEIAIRGTGTLSMKSEAPCIYNNSEKGLSISEATIIAESSSSDAAILSWGNLKITDSANITAKGSSGLLAKKDMNITDSKIVASGTDSGIIADGVIDIKDSKIDAIGNGGHGIHSPKSINIDNGDIHAKGVTAISTKNSWTEGAVAESKISVNGLFEKNNAKIMFSEWTKQGKWGASWTTFLNESESQIKLDSYNIPENAISEIRFVERTADYSKVDEAISKIPPDLNIYTTDSVKALNDANNAVDRSIKISKQVIVDNYAVAIENAIKNLVRNPSVSITDPESGIKIENEDGSLFDGELILKIIAMPKLEMDKFKATLNKVSPGFILKGLYDISLMKDGVVVQPKSKIKVSIPLTDELKAMIDLQVVSIDDKGAITIIPSEVKDDVITFTSDHFSYYGVIGKVKPAPDTIQKPDKTTPATGDHTQLTFYVIIALLSISSLLLITNKRKAR